MAARCLFGPHNARRWLPCTVDPCAAGVRRACTPCTGRYGKRLLKAKKAGAAQQPAAESAKANGKGKGKASAPATVESDPFAFMKTKAMLEKEARQASLQRIRTVHIRGAKSSGQKAGRAGGKVTMEIGPGAGIREVKKVIRQHFGKVRPVCACLVGAVAAKTQCPAYSALTAGGPTRSTLRCTT